MEKRLAIVGASGLVGRQLLDVLMDRGTPAELLSLYASSSSEGEVIDFDGQDLPLQQLDKNSFAGIDGAFFCATEEVSRHSIPHAVQAGCRCIDLAGTFLFDPAVPVVVPEINGPVLRDSRSSIVSSPPPSAIQAALILAALEPCGVTSPVVMTACLSASGRGRDVVDVLRLQSGDLLNGRPARQSLFPHPLAYNCVPQSGSFQSEGLTADERTIAQAVQRVLEKTDLSCLVTAVQVPVFYGHSLAMSVQLSEEADLETVRTLINQNPAMELVDEVDEERYPCSCQAPEQDEVSVGRLRLAGEGQRWLSLWSVIDNLRKGSALNAVQIAELWLTR